MSAQCPRCGEKGHVFRYNSLNIYVRMECPKCSAKWKTHSKLCPTCGKPNGYAIDGICSSCYSEKRHTN